MPARKAGFDTAGGVMIEGAAELERALKALPRKVARKVINKAVRKSGKILLDDVKARAPVGETRQLKASLKLRVVPRQKAGSFAMFVSTAEGWFKGDQFYGAFVEFGTTRMEPQPFARPAFESQKGLVRSIMEREIRDGVEREAAALNRGTVA